MTRKKTIVILGRFRSGTSEEGLQAGFREAGWVTHALDTRQTTGAPGHGKPAKIAYRLHEYYANKSVLNEFIETIDTLVPDVVLMMKRTDLPRPIMERVQEKGIKIVLFYPDVHFNHRTVNEVLFSHLDLLVTTKTYQIEYLKKNYPNIAVEYVPHGYVSNVHQPLYTNIEESDYQRDIAYAGNHSAYKAEFLDQVNELSKPATFMLTGPNWHGKISKNLNLCLDKVQRRNALYSELIQRSRINISIFAGPLEHGWQDFVSTRTFEIPAAGGFMLHIDNDEIRTFFEVGTEIDVFKTPQECADKIKFYLANPAVRRKMTQRAHRKCVPAYSYVERAKAIINLIEKL